LNKDQNKRLGAKNGLAEIKEHPFFASLDFDEVLSKKVFYLFYLINSLVKFAF
jgi:hypothetical protein